MPAERQETVARREFGKWIIENVDACFKIAVDFGYAVDRMEDIVLVTGCHLARSWVNIAFSESRGGAEVSFRVQVSGNSSVHFDERDVRGRGLKLGPTGENLPLNQCIFVRGFRVARFLNIWPRLRAAGSASDTGQPEPEPDRRLELSSYDGNINATCHGTHIALKHEPRGSSRFFNDIAGLHTDSRISHIRRLWHHIR